MIIDLRTVIINLLNIENRTWVSYDRLQKLLDYIKGNLGDSSYYKIIFDSDLDSIDRVATYNNNIFQVDSDNEIIYLYNAKQLSDAFPIDRRVKELIVEFINHS